MGKTRVVKSLGRRIGNIALHNLLGKYTQRPESKEHLESEEIAYRDSAIKEAKQYNWNEEDKQGVKQEALDFIKNKLEKKYFDVKIPLEETKKEVEKEPALKPLKCLRCLTINPATPRFCNKCGFSLNQEAAKEVLKEEAVEKGFDGVMDEIMQDPEVMQLFMCKMKERMENGSAI